MDVQQQFVRVVADAVGAIGAAAVPMLVYYVRRWLQAHLTERQLSLLGRLAADAVRMAQELEFSRGFNGAQKLEAATTMLTQAAYRLGVHLDAAEAQNFVHAALSSYRNELAELASLDLVPEHTHEDETPDPAPTTPSGEAEEQAA